MLWVLGPSYQYCKLCNDGGLDKSRYFCEPQSSTPERTTSTIEGRKVAGGTYGNIISFFGHTCSNSSQINECIPPAEWEQGEWDKRPLNLTECQSWCRVKPRCQFYEHQADRTPKNCFLWRCNNKHTFTIGNNDGHPHCDNTDITVANPNWISGVVYGD